MQLVYSMKTDDILSDRRLFISISVHPKRIVTIPIVIKNAIQTFLSLDLCLHV